MSVDCCRRTLYYAAASLAVQRRHGAPASFIIPAGNLGNTLALRLGAQLGFPIGDIVLAHNANRTVPDFLATGEYRPRPSIATLASAMDVGNPSNMERLQAFEPDWSKLRAQVSAWSVSDAEIREQIRGDFVRYQRDLVPAYSDRRARLRSSGEAERRADPG